jgi:2,4-dienoyl-CoA reductase-like NADH-dependent reductase (Old Yellow Enzyme family)/thioredoxin reductase
VATPWLVDRPLQVGPQTLRGRIYLPAHQPGLAEDGRPGERYIAYHRARARSGVAMQVTGATPILPSSEWNDICLWNIDESIVPGYQRLAEAVHEEGGRILAQLAHPGPTETEGPDVIGASWDFSEVARQVAVPATSAQLTDIIELYAAAADRCRRGELDGVEISLAHGLLLASFLSPLTNHRDDEFGGSFERRLTLTTRVLDSVRGSLSPGMILGIRLGADDLVEGGLRPDEAARVARALEDRVDYISVMVGNNNRLEARVRHWPPTPAPHGLFRDVARVIKEAVSVPVCAVGRVTDVDLANDILVAGDADLVGMVRAQIADPDLLAKTRAGRAEDVRPCVGVNVCVNGLLEGRPLSCFVNPDVGHEQDEAIDLSGRSAVVVGGGPAGLEAARRMAEAGCRVTLAEASDQLGGQVAAWSCAPSRSEVADYLHWQRRMLDRLGVEVVLGTAVDAAWVVERSPELVVVATGARPSDLDIPTDGSVVVVDPLEALVAGVNGEVVVFDAVGELDGALIAERLATVGQRSVTLATSRLHIGEGDGINTLFPMIRRLAEVGVSVVERVRPSRVEAGSVVLEGVFGEAAPTLAADALVTWAGGVPVNDLVAGLADHGLRVEVIGDALRPRRVVDALSEAKAAVDRFGTTGTTGTASCADGTAPLLAAHPNTGADAR